MRRPSFTKQKHARVPRLGRRERLVASAPTINPGLPEGTADVIRDCRRIVLLVEGHSEAQYAKTAIQLLRYRSDDVLAVFDSHNAGLTAGQLFGVGGATPVVGSLSGLDADSLFIGIATAGGVLPAGWREIISKALVKGLHIVSGAHDKLLEDSQLRKLTGIGGPQIIDVRNSESNQIAQGRSFRSGCIRVHTVGGDCSVGKMSAAKEIELGLLKRGRDALFLATGQTGIMIGGKGVAIDSTVSDFTNGAAEQLVCDNQQHDVLLIEGQGSLVHPAFSGVTMGLLHGVAPDALVLCYEAGRKHLKSMPHVPIWPPKRLREFYENVASIRHPCRVIGLALNGCRLTAAEAEREQSRMEAEIGLPVCDVYRQGPGRLVDAVEAFDEEIREQRGLVSAGKAAV